MTYEEYQKLYDEWKTTDSIKRKGEIEEQIYQVAYDLAKKLIGIYDKWGKKFRGTAYDVGCEIHTSSFKLYGWSGRGGWRCSESIKLWSPDKGLVYANPAYLEDREMSSEEVEAYRAKREVQLQGGHRRRG